ncbi:MAG: hypothetical protein A2V58_00715 [Candidatus Muproteobacteria bacterium RBG_19FT_COMBO_61_10]|uniref:Uncharacterized protein n=1 Tax=Candidatus Muproteobacteria bacterium RBG_19FT_COMBO_61_10 TaxID=1817761 RepID=A0A1F6UK90_9PROT|nr:MAG: hypothetical protein A2V58_00715 [Candidatus Muproteobacteria bacterium RBG_19FT_COMBO_61_10]
MQLVSRGATAFSIEVNQPLYKRVPARDEYGRMLSDFMVILPGLRERPGHEFAETLACLQAVLASFSEVVFVDLNVPLNLLWVSVRPRPGVILQLFSAVKLYLPEARLVGHRRQ